MEELYGEWVMVSQQFWAKDHICVTSYKSKMQGIYQIYLAAIEIYSLIYQSIRCLKPPLKLWHLSSEV